MGFTGFYRRFIQDYAKVARLLTELLRGCNPRKSKRRKNIVNTDWTWDEAQEKAYRELVQRLTNPPVFCTRLLKFQAPALISPLHFIINRSLITGIYPDKLKTSNGIPLYKKATKRNVITIDQYLCFAPSLSFWKKLSIVSYTTISWIINILTKISMSLEQNIFNRASRCRIKWPSIV